MQYREDKKSGNMLSVLGMGCMRLPGRLGHVDIEKTEKILLKAVESGINYIDTAYIYPGSEEAIGGIIAKNGLRDKLNIATKLPQGMCKKREDFDAFFNEQKRRLRTDYIDYYLLHNFTSLEQWENIKALGIKDWLQQKKESGEIKRVGFSFHASQAEFAPLVDDYDWDFVQIQYNYINTHYQAGTAGLMYAAQKGLPVIIMEPLLGGKLATGLPKHAQKIMRDADTKRTPAAWALSWLWNQPQVTVVLSGMRELTEVEQNAAIASGSSAGMLDKEDEDVLARVVTAFNSAYKIRCTGCNYCMPCPKNINIPGSFTAYNASYAMGWYTGVKQYMIAVGMVNKKPRYASACIGCGKCEKHCPQGIQIRKEIKKVRRRFESPITKLGARIVNKFFRKPPPT